MLNSRVAFVALFAVSAPAHASPAKPFVALAPPVEFCDARPAPPECLRESAQRWREFLAGTLPEDPHVTAMFRANVDRIDADGHQTVERGARRLSRAHTNRMTHRSFNV